MTIFHSTLAYVDDTFYTQAGLIVESVREEPLNAEYGAGIFQLNGISVRFRVAKTTPSKAGQFVVFWEKDSESKNRAFSYAEAPQLLVINAFHPDTAELGQFVFPKDVLKQNGVLATETAKGKMAMRVYPDWDTVYSKQAAHTQKWQKPYFSRVEPLNQDLLEVLKRLYFVI
ncbi:MepB family protein [Paenibacillus sp. FSL R7-0331]|uniref:MepB family protein n=1 Tax=Paenibacillus sp. FSL R7-0331 TaxID=1536773 RepID=UPI0004F5C924|nr:MepB family protein [Paenibacillus sp. FSL R7-0331]AIQ52519.1 MepB [Paenibacillus sp. FSL R7-0331]